MDSSGFLSSFGYLYLCNTTPMAIRRRASSHTVMPRRSLLELVHAMEASWNASSTSSSCMVTSCPSSFFKGASQMETPETTATFVYAPCATFGWRWRLSSSKFFSGAGSQRHHFLDTCFLCKKPITGEDIFMYRGDAPFCSEECRQDQMDMDEALEDDLILSRSSTALNHASSSMKRKPTLIFAPKDQFGAGRAVAAG